MKKYLKILKKCRLFFGIEDSDLLRMLECMGARVEVFQKRYTVFAEGSPAKYIGIVLSGSVQTVRVDFYGNRSIVGNMGAGEIFGEAFACAETEELPVSVIANEESEIMLLVRDHFLHTCSNNCLFHRQIIFNLMQDIAKKSITFHKKLEIVSKRTTRDKLMTYLALRAREVGSDSFDVPFDRQELADFLEVDRSGLSAEIGTLRKEGILESTKNHFRLL